MLARGEEMEDEIMLPEPGAEAEAPVPFRVPRAPRRVKGLPIRARLALALVLCVVIALCRILWPDGADEARAWIVGDGSEQVQQAFFSMEQALGEGGNLEKAWTAFCAELTDEEA